MTNLCGVIVEKELESASVLPFPVKQEKQEATRLRLLLMALKRALLHCQETDMNCTITKLFPVNSQSDDLRNEDI